MGLEPGLAASPQQGRLSPRLDRPLRPRFTAPVSDPVDRATLIRTLTFMNDPIWRESRQSVLDLRQVAVVETADREPLRKFISATPVGPSESVAIVKYDPQRVELRAMLDRPGLVILADIHYPGWRLTIDGKAARYLPSQSADARGRRTVRRAFASVYLRAGIISVGRDHILGGFDRALGNHLVVRPVRCRTPKGRVKGLF